MFLRDFLARRYGYSPVGLTSTLKFVTNRGLNKLLRELVGGDAVFSWFDKPFKIDDKFYSVANGYYFRASCLDDLSFMAGGHDGFQDGYLRRTLRDGSVFVDVGAHLGRFTLLGARGVGRRGLVVALEPDERVFRRLLENIRVNNLRNVIPLAIAASERDTISPFKLSKTSGWSSLTAAHEGFVVAEVFVPTFTLDTVVGAMELDRVDMVKIDVEGAEGMVLEGSRELLDTFRPDLLLEVHGENTWLRCRDILYNKGYEYSVIHKDEKLAFHFHVHARSKEIQKEF